MIVKSLPWIFGGVGWLLATIGIFNTIDRSVSLTHCQSHADLALARAGVLEQLVSHGLKGAKREDVVAILRQKYPEDQIYLKSNGSLGVNSVELTFQDDRLTGVRSD